MQATEKLTAGRELDALIAEKVMGWAWMNAPEGIPICYLIEPHEVQQAAANGYSFGRAKHQDLHRVPSYSTDIAAAWQVVEKLSKDLEGFTLFRTAAGHWIAAFGECSQTGAPTAPLAICLAALATLEEVK